MNSKTLLILAGLVVIVVGAWIIPKRLRQNESKRGMENAFARAVSVFPFDEVNGMTVRQGETTVTMAKKDGQWITEQGKKVDNAQVMSALEKVKGSIYTGPVSRAKENADKLGVGDAGTQVAMTSGGTVFTFVIGNTGPSYTTNYVRLDGSDETYLAAASLNQYFVANNDHWQSRDIVTIDPAQVHAIRIAKGSVKVADYTREGAQWSTTIGGTSTTTDDAAMQPLLALFNPLRASGFINDEEDMKTFEDGLKDAHHIVVYGEEDRLLADIILQKQDTEWWGRLEGDDQIYRLAAYTLEPLKIDVE